MITPMPHTYKLELEFSSVEAKELLDWVTEQRKNWTGPRMPDILRAVLSDLESMDFGREWKAAQSHGD